MWVKKQQLEQDMELAQNWKRSTRLYLSPYLFNFYSEYITQNARLDESQAGINIIKRKINMQMIPL